MTNNKEHIDRVFTGIACCTIAHFLFFVMGAVAKHLSETHHVIEIVFYRNFIVFIPLLLYILLRNKTHILKTKQTKLIGFRAVIGGVSLIVTYAALAELPMSYATVLFFMSTILTPVFSFLFLKEHVGIHRWSAVALGMVGVYVIAQPSGELSTLGMILALCAATMHAMMFIVLRKLKTEPPLTITFYFILVGTIIPALFMPWVATTPTQTEVLYYLLLAAAGGMGQLFIVNAYKYAPAAVVTPFAYSAIIWSLLADILIWQYELNYISISIGASLIIFAQLYILLREYINNMKSNNTEG